MPSSEWYQEMKELRADISKGICTLLHDRILLLEQYDLINIWLQADDYDVFNVGTVLGYRGDDWDTIKQYSGLWRADGRINFEQIRLKRLGKPTIRRRYQGNKLKYLFQDLKGMTPVPEAVLTLPLLIA